MLTFCKVQNTGTSGSPLAWSPLPSFSSAFLRSKAAPSRKLMKWYVSLPLFNLLRSSTHRKAYSSNNGFLPGSSRLTSVLVQQYLNGDSRLRKIRRTARLEFPAILRRLSQRLSRTRLEGRDQCLTPRLDDLLWASVGSGYSTDELELDLSR